MRLNNFETVDELVELGMVEFEKRSFAPTMRWMPSRQHVYTSQCKKYSKSLIEFMDRISEQEIIETDINPSQLVKSAQDFQLSARLAGMEKDVIIENFMKMANIGMHLKRYYYQSYLKQIEEIAFITEPSVLAKVNQLNGLLRAFSETAYFDDHTVSGEFYGELPPSNNNIVVRSYKRLCPSDYLNCFDTFNISRIETFCKYDNGNMDFDCLGNITYVDQIRPNIIGCFIRHYSIDGVVHTVSTAEGINSLIDILEAQLRRILNLFFSIDLHEKRVLLLSSSYYSFKPLFDIIGVDWKPTSNDIDLYINSLNKIAKFDEASESSENNGRKIVDPREQL